MIDSSVVVDALVDRDATLPNELHAPSLLDYEVASALRRHVRRDELDLAEATDFIEVLARWTLRRYDGSRLLPRAWALREDVSTYDATDVALAELTGPTASPRGPRRR